MDVSLTPAPRQEVRGLRGRLYASLSAVAGRLGTIRPFGVRPEESVMRFSERGRLFCACMPLREQRPRVDRRQVCRACGLDVRVLSRQVDRQLTAKEIQAVVRNLREAGIRSAGLEIPPQVATLRQLNAYLASDAVRPSGSVDYNQDAIETDMLAVEPSQIN